MKLTVIGGGGVRSPLFVAAAARHAGQIGLDELCLMDIDPQKLHIFASLSKALAAFLGSPLKITATDDPLTALDGADHVVTTIRVGGDQGRVQDERIALDQGVLGQETTGPGGFAMAMRSIPAILKYAGLLAEINPNGWIFNFTNPAGLVTQALRDAGFEHTIGICDSANAAQHATANWLELDSRRLKAEVFGLNHLSWARRVTLDGKDVLANLLKDPGFQSKTMLHLFDPEIINATGMWINEYLFYFYYPEQAIASISASGMTRGEEVAMLNQRLITQMASMDIEGDPQAALKAYLAYMLRRGSTYMHYGQAESPSQPAIEAQIKDWMENPSGEEAEGYAGVAFNLIEALQGDTPLYTGLNVPNEGAIACLHPDDVVEVSCQVDRQGVHPLKIGAIPEAQELLIRSVKRYERLAVSSIRNTSRQTAAFALQAHPLVQSYPKARSLVDRYLSAHADYVGQWS